VELRDGSLDAVTITPEELGVERAPAGALGPCEPDESAARARAVLDGEAGPARSIVVLNAGAAIYVADGAPTLADGVRAAEGAIDSGAARATLERFVERTQELAPA
jgi:anthranilate phosphoribosyltransferase